LPNWSSAPIPDQYREGESASGLTAPFEDEHDDYKDEDELKILAGKQNFDR